MKRLYRKRRKGETFALLVCALSEAKGMEKNMRENKTIFSKLNCIAIARIRNLLSEHKPFYMADLHIHSIYSADSVLRSEDILSIARNNDIEIISVTDHDSVDFYLNNDSFLQKYIMNPCEFPIILPGIEFTVKYTMYSTMCHILQYGIDIASNEFANDLYLNKIAYWNRIKKQFQRVYENSALQCFEAFHPENFNIKNFIRFYKDNHIITLPDYCIVMEYIFDTLETGNIPIRTLSESIRREINKDPCELRRFKRINAFNGIKFEENNNKFQQIKIISKLLAPRGVDDDEYDGYESSGSLSINDFGQISIESLNANGITVWAHPNEDKLYLIDDIMKFKCKVSGIELNVRNIHACNKCLKEICMKYGLFYTVGSDNHGTKTNLYKESSCYRLPFDELYKLYSCLIGGI